MIVCTIDEGWGPHFPIKKFEQQLLSEYLLPIVADDRKTVVINSVWYTTELHHQTMERLRHMDFDRIVLVSMLDCAIPHPEWFAEFGKEVVGVGYYPGANYLDFWALMIGKYFDLSAYNLTDGSGIDTAYMCLNRKPHWHRRNLYQKLTRHNIVERGIVSMGGDEDHPPQRILDCDAGGSPIAPNAGTEQNSIVNDIASLGHPANWQRHLLNVVTETVWDIHAHHFVSEKIFKPIIGCRPFLVYDPTGADQWLQSRGFVPYYSDFSDISDLALVNGEHHPEFLHTLCQQHSGYFQSKFVALHDKIMYNKNRFSTYLAEQQLKVKQGIQCQT